MLHVILKLFGIILENVGRGGCLLCFGCILYQFLKDIKRIVATRHHQDIFSFRVLLHIVLDCLDEMGGLVV